jgi:hypothetical protein
MYRRLLTTDEKGLLDFEKKSLTQKLTAIASKNLKVSNYEAIARIF